MKKIKIALLGFGRIGKIHFRNIQQYMSDVSEIVAVAAARYPKEEFRKEYGNIFFSNSAEEVIKFPGVDAVLICTPTDSHASHIELAALNGKHIFCEKPMDLSLQKIIMLAKLIDEANVKLMIGFNRRFDPDFMEAKNSIGSGKIGEVQIVKITSRDPGLPSIDYIKNSGGLFMDMAIHDFDMARYMTGREVVEVFSKGLVLVDEAVGRAGDIDTALTTLIFDNGTYAVIDNSRKAVYGYDQRLEVFGNAGMVQVENNVHHRNVFYNEQGIHAALPLDFFMERYTKSYRKEMELFINALVNNTQMPAGVADSLEATRIALAAKISINENRPVKLAEINMTAKD